MSQLIVCHEGPNLKTTDLNPEPISFLPGALRFWTREIRWDSCLRPLPDLHEGDQTVAECLIHSLASRTVINSKGLHVSITGESGKGKSHAIDMMRTLIPKQIRLEGRISDKVLFYMEDLAPGSVITLDDMSLSDQMQEILKGVTTSFQKPFPYRTVNKDRKGPDLPDSRAMCLVDCQGRGCR